MTTHPKRSSYGIFVRFRRSRLALRRGVTELADAIALAEELRASRFHDRGDIFLVKEPEGTIVELPTAAPEGAAPVEREAERPGLSPARASGEPALSSGPPAAKPGLSRILQLGERVDHARRAIARAHTAQDRFLRAVAAAEGVLCKHGESAPSDAFRRNHERLGTLVASVAQTLASFERVGTVMERRLERAWAEATGDPRRP